MGSEDGQTVLQACEPHETDAQVVAPGFLYDAVHQGEVVLALLGLEQAPVDDREHGVEIHLDQRGPNLPHVVEAGGSVFLEFSRQGHERLAVDDQLGGGPLFP